MSSNMVEAGRVLLSMAISMERQGSVGGTVAGRQGNAFHDIEIA